MCWPAGLFLSRDRAGEGFPSLALSPTGNSDQHSQELSDSDSVARLLRDDDSDHSFEGFLNPQACSEAVVSFPVVPVRLRSYSVVMAPASGGDVISLCSRSWGSAPDAVAPASTECSRSLPAGGFAGLMGRLLPAGSSLVVRLVPSAGGSSSRVSAINPVSLYRRFEFGLGSLSVTTSCSACGLKVAPVFRSTTGSC